jgi:dienelactone hydrolase
MWVETEAGTFDVGLVGEGDVTAIFVHQLDANACGWFLYAADLAAQGGVRAMLLNLCGASESECTDSELTGSGADAVLAAADRAIADGAKRVVVVGASIGGTTAIIAAIRDAEHREAGEGRLDAVADLSGPIASRGVDLRSVAAPIAIPMFLAVAPGDIAVTVDAMTQLAGMVASDQVTLITDGSGHGWDMLNSPGGPSEGTIGEQLADFIRS